MVENATAERRASIDIGGEQKLWCADRSRGNNDRIRFNSNRRPAAARMRGNRGRTPAIVQHGMSDELGSQCERVPDTVDTEQLGRAGKMQSAVNPPGRDRHRLHLTSGWQWADRFARPLQEALHADAPHEHACGYAEEIAGPIEIVTPVGIIDPVGQLGWVGTRAVVGPERKHATDAVRHLETRKPGDRSLSLTRINEVLVDGFGIGIHAGFPRINIAHVAPR